jgi:hypothetical protein
MMALKLLHVEWLKIRRRPAFWLSLLFYFGFLVLGSYTSYRAHRRHPAAGGLSLPDDWDVIGSSFASIGGMMLTVVVILLTASEKTWRTERQNVIDGLSRTQYFIGKLFLFVALAVITWAGTIAIITFFGALDRTITPSTAPLFDAMSVKLLGGLLVRLVLVAAVASCFALLSSGSGAALAFAVLFMIVQPPIGMIIADEGPLWMSVAQHLPSRVMDNLTNADIYDPVRLAALNERLRAMAGRTGGFVAFAMPWLPPLHTLLTAFGFIALFAAGSWASIRKRDL